jgi:hypothetical protein
VLARVRAEALRREQFLAVSRLGPYLASKDLDAEQLRARLDELESAQRLQMTSLTWDSGVYRDELEDARLEECRAGCTMVPLEDLEQAIATYLVYRLEEQIDYYHGRWREHLHREETLEGAMKLVLIVALLAALTHLLLQGKWGDRLVEILAIALPPLGIALYSLRGLYEWRRLSLAYREQWGELKQIRSQLLALWNKLQCGLDASNRREIEFQFKRLVLRAEELFAAEMHQWYVLVRSEGHAV